MHFTPTSASWLNRVERFFRDLTDKCIRRGVFHSVKELVTTIMVSVEANVDSSRLAGQPPYMESATERIVHPKPLPSELALGRAHAHRGNPGLRELLVG